MYFETRDCDSLFKKKNLKKSLTELLGARKNLTSLLHVLFI